MIKIEEGMRLSENDAISYGIEQSVKYKSAPHFGHIIIDNFLPSSIAENILNNFPLEQLTNDLLFEENSFERNKRQISPYDCTTEALNFFLFFNSKPFIQFLESLTGINGLFGDHSFGGGGFHEINRGGKLGIHADFRIHPKLRAHRRINVLIYLNKEWKSSWNGNLELWSPDMKEMIGSIEPIFNRCVIFNTEEDAYHGHPNELLVPDGVTRKSIALYYYTGSPSIYGEASNVSTIFKAKASDSRLIKINSLKQNLKEKYFSLNQWMPPILYYFARSIKKKIKK
jgi:hypothetical protein